MITKEIIINISDGLHARPAAEFIHSIKLFNSEIHIDNGKKRINAKSILNLMSVVLKKGDVIIVTVHGEDEKKAMDFIEMFLQSENK